MSCSLGASLYTTFEVSKDSAPPPRQYSVRIPFHKDTRLLLWITVYMLDNKSLRTITRVFVIACARWDVRAPNCAPTGRSRNPTVATNQRGLILSGSRRKKVKFIKKENVDPFSQCPICIRSTSGGSRQEKREGAASSTEAQHQKYVFQFHVFAVFVVFVVFSKHRQKRTQCDDAPRYGPCQTPWRVAPSASA